MKTIKLYRITDGNKVTVTPKKPAKAGYTTLSRLVADAGKILVNGDNIAVVIDTDTPADWTEVLTTDIAESEQN